MKKIILMLCFIFISIGSLIFAYNSTLNNIQIVEKFTLLFEQKIAEVWEEFRQTSILFIENLKNYSNNEKYKYIYFSLLNNLNKSSISAVSDYLFIAIKEWDKNLKVFFYDPTVDIVAKSKTYKIKDLFHESTSTTSFHSNDVIQYNEKTKEIFYLNQGMWEYAGACQNDDGTCYFRIYKIDSNSDEILQVLQFNEKPLQWVVNSINNSIIIKYVDTITKLQTYKKIDIANNQATTLTNISTCNWAMIISNDGKYIYQDSQKWITAWKNSLNLCKINLENGNVDIISVYSNGKNISSDTYISPNNQYLAFYDWEYFDERLFIYNIFDNELQETSVYATSNTNILWAGDSNHILVTPKEKQLAYYDFDEDKVYMIEEIYWWYPLSWSPSNRYIIYHKTWLNIYDFTMKNLISSNISLFNNEIDLWKIVWISRTKIPIQ